MAISDSQITAARLVYGAQEMRPEQRLTVIGALFGWNRAAAKTETTPAASPAPAEQRRTRPTRTATRQRSRSSGAAGLTEFQRQVLAQVPDTGGVQQSAIAIRGKRPNLIGRAVSQLKGMGLLIEQNGVLERTSARPEEERRAA